MKDTKATYLMERPGGKASASRRIEIDFLFLDLTTCTRCVGTDRNLEAALEMVQQVLEATGVEVTVRKILVESAEHARVLRFVSSPTIRVNGRDIALEFRESRCEDCESCACGESVNCRVWLYQGKEYTEAPVGMIVEAILRVVYGGPQGPNPKPVPYNEVPETLRRFFAGKEKKETEKDGGCCPPAEQSSCCEPPEKAACCGTSGGTSCGCR